MDLNKLTAVSPVDGRYRKQTEKLDQYFSEFALMKYRVLVEVQYFVFLIRLRLPQLEKLYKDTVFDFLKRIFLEFNVEDALRIKEIEKTTNHDLKAVEYFLRERFNQNELMKHYVEFIHFGLTSADVDFATARNLALCDATREVYVPTLAHAMNKLLLMVDDYKDITMLAYTHGQPASPTKLGKEINVFYSRLNREVKELQKFKLTGKFGGATGNMNAHYVSYPNIDWDKRADEFMESLGLVRVKPTTQIDPYDSVAAYCHQLIRINNILIDFCRDVWEYIHMEYFKQKIKKDEVGSSAMPHKINPIDFENAEGNLGIANSMLDHFANKLPISRLQRDLTDSTVVRNMGVSLAHGLIAFTSLSKGLDKLVDQLDLLNYVLSICTLQLIFKK